MSNPTNDSGKSPNITELIQRGTEIYAEIEKDNNIEATNAGQYIAIDTGSHRYFIAETKEAAISAGEAQLPNVVFFVRRIGNLDVIAGRYPYFAGRRVINAGII